MTDGLGIKIDTFFIWSVLALKRILSEYLMLFVMIMIWLLTAHIL